MQVSRTLEASRPPTRSRADRQWTHMTHICGRLLSNRLKLFRWEIYTLNLLEWNRVSVLLEMPVAVPTRKIEIYWYVMDDGRSQIFAVDRCLPAVGHVRAAPLEKPFGGARRVAADGERRCARRERALRHQFAPLLWTVCGLSLLQFQVFQLCCSSTVNEYKDNCSLNRSTFFIFSFYLSSEFRTFWCFLYIHHVDY